MVISRLGPLSAHCQRWPAAYPHCRPRSEERVDFKVLLRCMGCLAGVRAALFQCGNQLYGSELLVVQALILGRAALVFDA